MFTESRTPESKHWDETTGRPKGGWPQPLPEQVVETIQTLAPGIDEAQVGEAFNIKYHDEARKAFLKAFALGGPVPLLVAPFVATWAKSHNIDIPMILGGAMVNMFVQAWKGSNASDNIFKRRAEEGIKQDLQALYKSEGVIK